MALLARFGRGHANKLKRPGSFPWAIIGLATIVTGIAILAKCSAGSMPADDRTRSTSDLVYEATIPLKDGKGRIDHMAVDVRGKRLFVAELANGTVGIIDLTGGKVVKRLSGFKEPQGIVYVAKTDNLFVANGGTGTVEIRKGGDFGQVAAMAIGEDADNMRLDDQGRVVVGYGNGGLAVFDPLTGTKLADIRLAAHPEAFLPEPGGNRIFVNEPNAFRLGVIDTASGKEIARWTTFAAGNFPMALDPTGHRLFVVYRVPAIIAAFDTKSGAVIGRYRDLPRRRRCILRRDAASHLCHLRRRTVAVLDADKEPLRERGRLQTRNGARTALFVPELNRLYVVAPALAHKSAEILVYRPH